MHGKLFVSIVYKGKVICSSGTVKVKGHICTESRLAGTEVQGATIRALLSISF